MKHELIILEKINIAPLLKAQKAFNDALNEAKSKLEQAGAIQHFEFTYELVWKTLKKILDYKGIIVTSPRDTFRAAGQGNLIDNVEFWMEVVKKRNIMSHIYQEEYAETVFSFLPQFKKELDNVIETIKKL